MQAFAPAAGAAELLRVSGLPTSVQVAAAELACASERSFFTPVLPLALPLFWVSAAACTSALPFWGVGGAVLLLAVLILAVAQQLFVQRCLSIGASISDFLQAAVAALTLAALGQSWGLSLLSISVSCVATLVLPLVAKHTSRTSLDREARRLRHCRQVR